MKTARIELRRWVPNDNWDWDRRNPGCRRRACCQQGEWNARYYDRNSHLLQSYWWCDAHVPARIKALPRHGGNYPEDAP